MNVPEPWAFVLLALATYRVFRLLAEDTILDRPRTWLLRGDPDEDESTQPDAYRETLAYFVRCPWCLGLHLACGIYLLWLWLPTATLTVSTPLAMSSCVGLLRANLD